MSDEVRREAEATLAARQELGPGHDDALVDGFLERIDRELDRRIDQRVARRAPRGSPLNPATLGVCIPIIAIAGGIGGVAGLAIVSAALVIVFVIASLR
jgi:hypothetical protein